MVDEIALDAPLSALALHPRIEELLAEAGCRKVSDVLELDMRGLQDCGISPKELKELVDRLALPARGG